MKIYDIHAPTPQGPAARDKHAFLVGLNFHEAALRAGQQECDADGAPIAALCPMIVCYAFAAELYLKSLAQAPKKNHRLNVLHAQLGEKARSDLAAFYEARTGRKTRDLAQDLRAFATAFCDWRYIFEGEGQQIRLNHLIAFTQAVYETIRLHRPEWRVSDCRDESFRARQQEHLLLANLGGGTFIHLVDGTGTLNLPQA